MKVGLPDDEGLRQVLVPLDVADCERARFGNEKGVSIPKGALPVPVGEYVDYGHPVLAALDGRGLLRVGNVLVRSPFDSHVYEREEDAVLRFHIEKLALVSELCQILGAASVKSDVKTFKMRTAGRSGFLGAGRAAMSGKATLNYVDDAETKLRLNLDDTFDGGEPDIDGARAFLAEHALQDRELTHLVDMRARPNTFRTRQLTITHSSESDSGLELSANIHLPFAEIGGEYRSKKRITESFTQTLMVDFGQGRRDKSDRGAGRPSSLLRRSDR